MPWHGARLLCASAAGVLTEGRVYSLVDNVLGLSLRTAVSLDLCDPLPLTYSVTRSVPVHGGSFVARY